METENAELVFSPSTTRTRKNYVYRIAGQVLILAILFLITTKGFSFSHPYVLWFFCFSLVIILASILAKRITQQFRIDKKNGFFIVDFFTPFKTNQSLSIPIDQLTFDYRKLNKDWDHPETNIENYETTPASIPGVTDRERKRMELIRRLDTGKYRLTFFRNGKKAYSINTNDDGFNIGIFSNLLHEISNVTQTVDAGNINEAGVEHLATSEVSAITQGSKSTYKVCVVLFLFGLIFIGLSIRSVIGTIHLIAVGKTTEATRIGFKETYNDGSYSYRAIYEFKDEKGLKFQVISGGGSSTATIHGSKTNVMYDPARPTIAKVMSYYEMFGNAIIFAVIGFPFFFFFGMYLLFYRYRKRRLENG